MRKYIFMLVVLLVIAIVGVIVLSSCDNTESNKETSILLKEADDEIVIGLKQKQEWKFTKVDGQWLFDGISVNGVRTFAVNDGEMFKFSTLAYNRDNPNTVIDSKIKSIEVAENSADKKCIVLSNDDCTMTLTVCKGDRFVKRDVVINFDCDNKIADYQISFALRTVDGLFERQDGAIATKNNTVATAEIPYAYPAIYAQVYGQGNTTDIINIVDYNATSFAINNMRNRKVQDVFEFGSCSGDSAISAMDIVELHDYWYFDSQTGDDMYALIGKMTEQMSIASPMAFENLASQGNVNVEYFKDLCQGLYEDLSDSRTLINNGYVPYAYSQGWSESFSTLDVLKGLIRYAKQIGDDNIYNKSLAILKYMLGDNGWVTKYDGANAKNDEYFLYQSFDGKYSANSSGEETGNTPGISTWKYYDTIANIAELAMFTNDQDVTNGLLRLMPFFNSLVLDNYEQPVAWYYATRQPAAGFDQGGSGGAAAIWGYVHLVASQLTEDQTLKQKWQNDGLMSLKHANELGFFKMHSIRVAVKSVSIGWAVRANVLAYNITNDDAYMDMAKHIAQGMSSFYYTNNNPYTFFTSYGYSYACTRERWEAYFETANAIWLLTDVADQMTDRTEILDLFYASSRSHQWFFPVNANPYGNYTGPLDSIDAHYVPFEFGTGVLGDDPGNEGGSQALLRQTKEIYGCGETFLEYLMFEAFGKSVDSRLLCLCTTSSLTTSSHTDHRFIVYNPFEQTIAAPIIFDNFATGAYEVKVNGQSVGTYTSKQLKNALTFDVNGRQAIIVDIERVGEETETSSNEKISVVVSNVTNASATLTFSQEYDHYIVRVSKYADFSDAKCLTEYATEKQHVIHFEDNSQLYVTVAGVDKNGIATIFSDVAVVNGLGADVVASDNFENGGALEDWQVTNGEGKSDFYAGQFYTSSDLRQTSLIASKTFAVDASAKIFEVRFVTKNANSTINVLLQCNGKSITAFGDVSVLQKGAMQFNLQESGLFQGLQGVQNVKVVVQSFGKSRGFAIDYVRFINPTEHKSANNLLDSQLTNEFCSSLVVDGRLSIVNDAEPTVISEPSIDVLFKPLEMPIWDIEFEGYRAIDKIRLTIANESKTIVADTGWISIATKDGKLKYDVVETFGLTQEGVYTFSYEVSNERVRIAKMQLIGESNKKEYITKADGVVDGNSAYINESNEIKLKPGTIYNYGEVRKVITVDMDNNPIVFFNISKLVGSWSAKVVPYGSVGDIALTPDTSQMGKVSYDLRSVISATGKIDLTFCFFVIGGTAGDQNAVLKIDDVTFGNSIELVAEKTDQVVSSTTLNLGQVNLDNTKFVHFDVDALSSGAMWKIYVVDNETGRSVELRNSIERKFNAKYNRSKLGHYVFDITEISGMVSSHNLSIKIVLIGNSAQAKIADLYLSNTDTLRS